MNDTSQITTSLQDDANQFKAQSSDDLDLSAEATEIEIAYNQAVQSSLQSMKDVAQVMNALDQ